VKIDIATTRHESYAQPAALPDVKPASLTEDLHRRDFTINAMAVRLNAAQFGQLYDLYNGQRDLKAKTIRVLHERSFHDDPTRIFRAVRFAQRFGFRIEPHTAELLQEAASTNRIAQLSGPRLCHEILLLCSESKPHPSFQWLERLKLLRFLHPNLRYPGSRCGRNHRRARAGRRTSDRPAAVETYR
jgi:tRNA nucleotidyltransferase (CCA-adding enzyme)